MSREIKKALITGVHKGLGRALAELLLERGCFVYGISRQAPKGLGELGPFRFQALDLQDFDAIPIGLAELLDGESELDLLLLNAGLLGSLNDMKDTSQDEIRQLMDVNVWANKHILDAVLERVRVAQVVAISSGASKSGSGGWGPYAISKAAINVLMQVYAHEHPECHFNALAPGIVHTDMIDYVLAQKSDPRHGANDSVRQAHEQGRVQTLRTGAEGVLAVLNSLMQSDNGSFQDVRRM